MRFAVAYYRVSTSKQGKSGLGLEAQQAAVRSYCTANDYTLVEEIQEVKSTRKHRPALQKALLLCREGKATLIVARLDRLGRDVAEIATIIKSSVDIVVTDNPNANRFTIHILAAVAEEQRRTISVNTRAALQAAKRRGRQLGKNGAKLSRNNKDAANRFAQKMKPTIQALYQEGVTTVRAIAQKLNERAVETFRKNGRWHASSVFNLLNRIAKESPIRSNL